MLFYNVLKRDFWLKKAILPLAAEEKNIDADTYEMVKNAFDHAAVKAGMPSNADVVELEKCVVPTLVVAAEKDCLFPGEKVIVRARKMLPDCKTHLLQNQGHLCILPADVINMIQTFIIG